MPLPSGELFQLLLWTSAPGFSRFVVVFGGENTCLLRSGLCPVREDEEFRLGGQGPSAPRLDPAFT